MNNILDNYLLPGDANEALAKKGMQSQSLGDGVSRLVSGHDQGVGYRFFIHAELNKAKSELAGYEVNDEIEMIEMLKSRKQKPCHRVKELPPELLKWDRDGNCVGGRYMEAYLRFKAGQGVQGMSLEKWNELTVGQVKSLNSENVFTVEQFAEWPESKVQAVFTQDFVDAHKKAVLYVGGTDIRARNQEQVEKMLEMERKIARLQEQLEDKPEAKPKAKRGRPKKTPQSVSLQSV